MPMSLAMPLTSVGVSIQHQCNAQRQSAIRGVRLVAVIATKSRRAIFFMHLHFNQYLSGVVSFVPFSGVGAIVASFVSTECPIGREGSVGIFGKPLKSAFRRCVG